MDECIEDKNQVSKVETEISQGKTTGTIKSGSVFICKTCVRYLKAGKIPPSSVKNSLELHETDNEIKEEDLVLTELEGALIAKTIIFAVSCS